MTTTTDIKPYLSDLDSDDGDDFSHYARSADIAEAAVMGGKITALCGFKFEPIRDPTKFPVCPKCKELIHLANQMG